MNDRNWTLLMDAILERKVVLILGDNLFHMADNPEIKAYDYILKELNDKFASGQDYAPNFTEANEFIIEHNLRNRRSGDTTNIYYEIGKILKTAKVSCPPAINQLVESGFFPLVMTTSFIPEIGNVLGIRPSSVDAYRRTQNTILDASALSSSHPSLFHLFGQSSTLAKTYMVTEDDLLDYIHCWHDSETRPSKITNYLSGKYLLILGCDYPNWLFRFFWHSIKDFKSSLANEEQTGIVSLESSNDDKDLRNFLYRIQANVCLDASSFLNELLERLNTIRGDKENDNQNDVTASSGDIDFFISYAKEDVDEAEFIANTLIECGVDKDKIWFDKERLKVGEEYTAVIKQSINKAKRFVAVLSQTSLTEEPRYFKREWTFAEKARELHFKGKYIIPIIVDGSDINQGFSELFSEVHCINSSDPDFKSMIKELVRDIRR